MHALIHSAVSLFLTQDKGENVKATAILGRRVRTMSARLSPLPGAQHTTTAGNKKK